MIEPNHYYSITSDICKDLSKSTEVLAFKSTQVPKVIFIFLCQCTDLFVLYIILAILASEATYNALQLLNTLTNLQYLWNKELLECYKLRNKTRELRNK